MSNDAIYTTENFKEAMVKAKQKWDDDTEMSHIEMDSIMCDLLKHLGYGEGVEVFKAQKRWYA